MRPLQFTQPHPFMKRLPPRIRPPPRIPQRRPMLLLPRMRRLRPALSSLHTPHRPPLKNGALRHRRLLLIRQRRLTRRPQPVRRNILRNTSMSAVNHDPGAHQFTTEVNGERAVLDYTLLGNVMTITHTGVPRQIEGRGVAAELTREALKTARTQGWRVVPQCSYAVAYLAKHPQAGDAESVKQHQSDLLDEALDESFPASDSPAVGGSN